MKVTITQMKAPWPEGAALGDVVEIPGDALPSWAEGKCTKAADDAVAVAVFEPKAPPMLGGMRKHEEADKDAANANAAALLSAAQQEAHELKQLLSAMTFERDAALAKVTELQAAVDAAQKKPAK